MTILYVFIVVLAISAAIWLMLSKKRTPEKAAAYDCPYCGERDCDCYREDQKTAPDGDGHP